MDCLQGLAKARDLKMFNFQDFNYEEYVRLDKIQGGDLNWIIPGILSCINKVIIIYDRTIYINVLLNIYR